MTNNIPVVALNATDHCDWCGETLSAKEQHIWPIGDDDYAIVCGKCVIVGDICDLNKYPDCHGG